MNKKGAGWSLLQTLTLVGGVVAALLLLVIVYRFTSQERGEMTFLAIDSAMLTDAILASPQDVQLVYPQEATQWYVRLNQSSVSVFPGEPQPGSSSFYTAHFIGRKDITINEGLVNLPLFLIKQKNDFFIDNKPMFTEATMVIEGENVN